ncbi:uncharacterized protein [Onthophagus taurus]|uniref:uncharacterized protein n=1 Tax=Onthophagus taurus TaxID=166361 RepID=UPI0039BE82FD
MNGDIEIRNIESLFSAFLKNGKKFVSYEYEKLLPPGENYGSIMLKLKAILSGENGEEEIVNCVAKLVPPTPFLWKMFNTPVTFKKEIGMYKIIGPLLNEFGREHGVDNLFPLLPDYVGARISLDPESTEVDHDAVLVLKNILEDGYVVGDRFKGFDKETTNMFLRSLAVMHASTIALKLKKPTAFKEKIHKLIEVKMPVEFNEESMQKVMKQIQEGLSRNERCLPYIEKVLTHLEKVGELMTSDPREPFATLVHNDFWTNNMMVKFENGKPVSTRFIDFQIIEYDNPLKDVLFFLYTSTRLDLLEYVDDFLDEYYKEFISILKRLDCETSPFSKSAFFDEIKAAAEKELIHIIFMLLPLYTRKGEAKELTQMNGENDIFVAGSSLDDGYYPRLHFVVLDFFKRCWI